MLALNELTNEIRKGNFDTISDLLLIFGVVRVPDLTEGEFAGGIHPECVVDGTVLLVL